MGAWGVEMDTSSRQQHSVLHPGGDLRGSGSGSERRDGRSLSCQSHQTADEERELASQPASSTPLLPRALKGLGKLPTAFNHLTSACFCPRKYSMAQGYRPVRVCVCSRLGGNCRRLPYSFFLPRHTAGCHFCFRGLQHGMGVCVCVCGGGAPLRGS